MVTHSVRGISYLFRGLVLLIQPGIRTYVIIPLLLNMFLFGLGVWYAYGWLQALLAWVYGLLPGWLDWLAWIVVPLFIVAVAVLIFFSFSMLANMIAAPFNTLLAERIEHHLTGRFPEEEAMAWQALLVKAVPLVWNEVAKTLYTLFWAIPFLVLFLIPFVQIVAPLLWLAYSAWMLAIQYLDIPMGNHGITGKQLRRQVRRERFLSLGFGGTALLLTVIPFVNFIAMPAAVAGATLLWVERFLPHKDRIMAE